MKLKMIIQGRILIIGLLLIYNQHNSNGQMVGSEKWKQPGFFFGVGVGLTNAQILNKATKSIPDLSVERRASILGSIEAGFFFSKHFGLVSGVSYYSYSSDLFIDSYQNQFNAVDRENESFDLQISGNDIKEIQDVDILSIPLCLNIRKPLNTKSGFFMQAGVNVMIPMNKTYKSSGTYTYKGYFPAYNVLLENLPDYGFPSDLKVNSNGELSLKPINYGVIASAGIDYLLQKRVQLTVYAIYDRSLSNITNYSLAEEFYLSTHAGEVNSIMSGSSKTSLQCLGLKVGVRYFISSFEKNKYQSRPTSRQYLRERIRQQRKGFVPS